MNTSTIYLIPTVIDDDGYAALPAYLLDAVKQCSVFFVENERTARRYLKKLWPEMVIDNYAWFTIHKAEKEVKQSFISNIRKGKTIGIISEAGCPGIADPGQLLVETAQKEGATIKPLIGPNSMLLALMASGMNGQLFKFNGYMPIEDLQQSKAIKALELESSRNGCTQIFIETPYRNNRFLDALLKHCAPHSRLCIAVGITGPDEQIKTLSIAEWKKNRPDINKKPTVFLLSAQ